MSSPLISLRAESFISACQRPLDTCSTFEMRGLLIGRSDFIVRRRYCLCACTSRKADLCTRCTEVFFTSSRNSPTELTALISSVYSSRESGPTNDEACCSAMLEYPFDDLRSSAKMHRH